MHLSNKQKTFCQFVSVFLKSRSYFEHFGKTMILIAVFPKLRTAKDVVKQMSKKPCFRRPFVDQNFLVF